MRVYTFDIETNGFLEKLDRVHSIVIEDISTGEKWSCAHASGFRSIEWGLTKLAEADLVVGHNIIKFDIPALRKVYPYFDIPFHKVRDTLLLTRLLWGHIGDSDHGRIAKGRLPPKMRGRHSLAAWGYRMGILKGDFGETTDWSEWTPEMQTYCEQDVTVTTALWHRIQKANPAERAVILEHKFCHAIVQQEQFGFRFDVEKAVQLYAKLQARRDKIDEELKALFKPWYVRGEEKTPKVNNSRHGYVKGQPFTKVILQEFNPGSRMQIAARLKARYGWAPKNFTPTGQPQIDETTLTTLKKPAAKLLIERFLLDKRIGQLAEGDQAWLRAEKNGRIHGSVNTIGAITGRCTHSQPNVAQVPGVKALFGKECRELFHVDPGFIQIGADASGLELRCLAHFMAAFDGGKYAKLLLEGDVHTANQEAAGLPSRDDAKTFIYAFLYGAGDAKIGNIIGKGPKAGKKLKTNFLAQTPALKRLREAVQKKVEQAGFLYGIDGRKLHIRSAHAALNTLLQSAGALLVKQATINLFETMERRGFVFGRDWAMVAHVHDEYQLQVRQEFADEVAEIAVEAFREAGRQFKWRCPLDGEAKIGKNWSECH